MKVIKKLWNRIFIDGLTGMAHGLFATLIIGTIIQQIGPLVGGQTGNLIFLVGKIAAALTGAGIGVGVAYRFKESPLVVLSAAVAGMIGAFASQILAGSVLLGEEVVLEQMVLKSGTMLFSGPGEPLGAFLAAYIGIEVGHLVSGRTKVDIIVTPIVTIGAGSVVGIILGPPISNFMTMLGEMINWLS